MPGNMPWVKRTLDMSRLFITKQIGQDNILEITTKIADAAANMYSQFGEDGIIDKIFEMVGTENRWCLEVGASDGLFCSNTRHLIERGWNGILIEGDPEQFRRLVTNLLPNIICVEQMVSVSGSSRLDAILERCEAPKDIDLVSIDVDGQDYYIFNSMVSYSPRVVIVEHSPEDEDFIPVLGGDGQAGREAIKKLLASRHYKTLIQTDTNTIAVRLDVFDRLKQFETNEQNPKENINARLHNRDSDNESPGG